MIVKLHYGQYKVCGILKYRTHRLCGLRQELCRLGYNVQTIPSQHMDRLEVEVAGRNVFTCRLSFLEYNCRYEDDKLANKIVEAIKNSFYALEIPEPKIPTPYVPPSPSESEERPTPVPSTTSPSNEESGLSGEDNEPPHIVLQYPEPQICRTCAECVPYCKCPEIEEEPMYKSCNVCGPYCVCDKVSSSEFINLCTKCKDTCLCSSNSDLSVNICNVIVKRRDDKDEESPYSRRYGRPECDICDPICECDSTNPICL